MIRRILPLLGALAVVLVLTVITAAKAFAGTPTFACHDARVELTYRFDVATSVWVGFSDRAAWPPTAELRPNGATLTRGQPTVVVPAGATHVYWHGQFTAVPPCVSTTTTAAPATTVPASTSTSVPASTAVPSSTTATVASPTTEVPPASTSTSAVAILPAVVVASPVSAPALPLTGRATGPLILVGVALFFTGWAAVEGSNRGRK